jgi:hypothetical protein
VAATLNDLAVVYQVQGKGAEALAAARKASVAIIAHSATEAAGAQQKSSAKSPSQNFIMDYRAFAA